jgi:hypothetical protein
MNISELIKLTLQNGLDVLSMLPEPEQSPLADAKPADLYPVCEHFFKLWKLLLIQKEVLPEVRIEIDREDKSNYVLKGEELWDKTLMTVAVYYEYAFRKYATSLEKNQELPPGLVIKSFSEFLFEEAEPLHLKFMQLRILTFRYFTCIFALYVLRMYRRYPPHSQFLGASGVLESTLHVDLNALCKSSQILRSHYLRVMGKKLLQGVLEYAEYIYSDQPVWNKDHQPGPFSSLVLSELSLLAKRDTSVTERYGDQNIARIFESQLALLAQSFGLYVVSTRLASRTVDLVCISSDPTNQLTFLIEAKTTKGAYSLPSKDSRALRDYVDDIKKSLVTLPQLSFVLLVGPLPTKTIKGKIIELQSQTGLPVRYCSAQQIADLRERIPGPLPLKVFREQVVRSDPVLSDNFVDAVVTSYRAEQKAHVDFVEKMLSARGVTVARPPKDRLSE